MNWFRQIVDRVQKLFDKHGGLIARILGGIGAALAGIGIFNTHKANKTNNEAEIIRDEAISKYKQSEKATNIVLNTLGKKQIEVITTFPRFLGAMEQIQGRPKGLADRINIASVYKYNPNDLIEISSKLILAINGAGGVVAGLPIGIAAYGMNILALGPGAFAGGVVLCAMAESLSKKAAKNKRQALDIQKDVEKIIEYHTELRDSAMKLCNSINDISILYYQYLEELEDIVEVKTKWKQFTPEEKNTVKILERLVGLLNKMCKVELVIRSKKENEIETVNSNEVNKLVKSGKDFIAELN